MKPKTLNDVIEEMHDIGFIFNKKISSIIRLACEAMAKEIVPEEDKDYSGKFRIRYGNELDDEYQRGYNSCRSDILECAEKFMKEKK